MTHPDPLLAVAADWFSRLRSAPTEDDRAEFRAWIEADSAHLEAYRRVETSWALLGLAGEKPAVRRWRAEAVNRTGKALSRRLLLAGGLGAVAASVAALAWVATPRPVTYATAARERLTVALDDGSQVSLAPATRLRVRYGPQARQIDLEAGQAYFIVAKAPDRPFRVHAADRIVTALGTQFQMRLEPAGAEVILAEGRIDVRSSRGLRQSVELTAGQKLAATAVRPRPADVQAETAWRSGRLVFRDRRLDDVIDEFNRWSPVALSIGDAEAGEVRISGTFSADGAQAFAEALETVFGLSVSTERDGSLVVRSAPAAVAGS